MPTPSRKFTPSLKLDTLPSAYRQADHLSPADSPITGSKRISEDVRRRTPSASPGAGGAGGEKGYFPRPISPSPASLSASSSSRPRWKRIVARIPIPPVVRRWLSNPLVLGVFVLCSLAVAYRSTHRSHPTPNRIPAAAKLELGVYEDLIELPSLPGEYRPYFPDLALPESLRTTALESLAERLYLFLLRPVSSHEDAKQLNEDGCPVNIADGLVNPDQLKGNREWWEAVDAEEIRKRRAGIVKSLARWVGRGESVVSWEGMAGKGIVLTGGGDADTTLRTISLLKHLRNLKNDLPIEVFHYPGELGDWRQRTEMEELGAEIREVQGLVKPKGLWKNFQIKGLALVQSKFQEIIYMDSDNMPLRPLTSLFTSPTYLATGAVFWPDLNKDHPHNAIWRVIGDVCSLDDWSFESGQMLINKAGNGGLTLAALWIAAHMMSSPTPPPAGGWWGGKGDEGDAEAGEQGEEEREWWFHMCGGDKDTFRWAFRVLDIPWSSPGRWMSLLGFENQYDNGRFCGHTTLQYDLDIPLGAERELPLFVHGNLLKHITASGLGPWNAFTHVKRFRNDAYSNPDLNFAHGNVYHNNMRGMCLDFEWGSLSRDRISQEERDNGILHLKVEDIGGRPFEGWQQAFHDVGGRIGGW